MNGVRRDRTPSVLHVVVELDRQGAVRRSADEIKTGTGNSMYSGTVAIGTSGSAGDYTMTDPTRGGNNTTDLRGATSGTGTLFTDADDVWGNGTDRRPRRPPASTRTTAPQTTWDYYKNVLGRNGIVNDGIGAYSPRPLRQRATSTRSGTTAASA